ncbi:MAG: hydrogenase nickel incorporation protein HypB [Firmicutes bacterium]|nr:hydrogenase nickel incorporation protein HypB [Bacillota bacterium]
MKVQLVSNILDANTVIAKEMKRRYQERGILVLNLMSAPGAGKTTILENTIECLKEKVSIAVIEGDICTTLDADRIASHGVPVVQINTEGACHLDANMIARALDNLPLEGVDLLIIENVGNLVCPAEFDLGEDLKVMVISVTEGNDKPNKYPLMFHESRAILVNKQDLLPYTNFDMGALMQDLADLNPHCQVFPLSARTGEGVSAWVEWLEKQVRDKKGQGQ